MSNIEIVKSYLGELTLDNTQCLVDALNACGAILGLWGIGCLSEKKLRCFTTKRARTGAYIEFDVPKKDGGVRRISAPIEPLKHIQQALNHMLQAFCDVSEAAMGFVAGRSIHDNAHIHLGSSVIFNCDLKDFFPSITKTMIRRTLKIELQKLHASRDVINMICNLVTMPRADGVEALPQGAPSSPFISNLVLKQLDRRLLGFAEKNGYRYSRYADDITFSRTGNYSPAIPIKSYAILKIIEGFGLTVNPKKTVIQTVSERHEVTGLIVSDKVNISRKYIKQLRTLLHLWETRGFEEAQIIFNRDFRNGNNVDFAKVINGKINYICMVKGIWDPTYRSFKFRYRQLMKQLKSNNEHHKIHNIGKERFKQ